MKKFIGLFALVAVVSLVGCGGAQDGSKQDEQKAAARPDGTYAVTSYVCENGGTDILAAIGPSSSMSITFAGEAVTFEKMIATFFQKLILKTVKTTYSMKASVSETSIQVNEVQSKVITNMPGHKVVDRDDGAAADEAQFLKLSATYSLNDKTLTLAIAEDHHCGGSASKVTAEKQ